jgi:hypothetical protein
METKATILAREVMRISPGASQLTTDQPRSCRLCSVSPLVFSVKAINDNDETIAFGVGRDKRISFGRK